MNKEEYKVTAATQCGGYSFKNLRVSLIKNPRRYSQVRNLLQRE